MSMGIIFILHPHTLTLDKTYVLSQKQNTMLNYAIGEKWILKDKLSVDAKPDVNSHISIDYFSKMRRST